MPTIKSKLYIPFSCPNLNMEYICFNCGGTVKADEVVRRIRCLYCGGRILYKKRPKIVKSVKAR